MIKRKNQISAYQLLGNKGAYIVAIEHLHNTESGCPRFRACIMKLEENQDGKLCLKEGESLYNAVYHFTGHYLNERGEARWILDYHENKGE